MGGHRASGAGDDLVDGPVDLAAVRADDALLDAIAGGAGRAEFGAGYGFGSSPADDQADDEHIAAILAAWRADIEADPMPELVSLDEAMDAVSAGHEARDRVRGRARRRMPFAVAAAAAIVAVAGLTMAVHGSKPGDTLFGVSKVFFSEHAAEVQKVEDVRSTIERANDAIARGDNETARRELESANLVLPALPAPEREPLQTRSDEVKSSLAPEPPASSTSRPSSKSPEAKAPGTKDPGRQVPKPDAGDPRKVPAAPQSPTDSSSTTPDTSTSGQTPDAETPRGANDAPSQSTTSPTTTTTTPPPSN